MNFNFTDEETQLIVNVLAQRPYAEVFNLMNSIQRQVTQAKQPQLQAVEPQQAAG